MAAALLSNPVSILWPEALLVAGAIVCLAGMKTLVPAPITSLARVRLQSILGFIVTGSTVLLGVMPSLYTITAILLILAPFAFAAVAFRPALVAKGSWLHTYLTFSVVVSALVWTMQFFWLLTR
jgi:hypothetical protein